jgi:hypothetical protein
LHDVHTKTCDVGHLVPAVWPSNLFCTLKEEHRPRGLILCAEEVVGPKKEEVTWWRQEMHTIFHLENTKGDHSETAM